MEATKVVGRSRWDRGPSISIFGFVASGTASDVLRSSDEKAYELDFGGGFIANVALLSMDSLAGTVK